MRKTSASNTNAKILLKRLGNRETTAGSSLEFRISFSSRCGFLTYNRDDKSVIVQMGAPLVTADQLPVAMVSCRATPRVYNWLE